MSRNRWEVSDKEKTSRKEVNKQKTSVISSVGKGERESLAVCSGGKIIFGDNVDNQKKVATSKMTDKTLGFLE